MGSLNDAFRWLQEVLNTEQPEEVQHRHVEPTQVQIVGPVDVNLNINLTIVSPRPFKPVFTSYMIGLERKRDDLVIAAKKRRYAYGIGGKIRMGVAVSLHDNGVIGVGYDLPLDEDQNPLPLDGAPTVTVDDPSIATVTVPSADAGVSGSAFTLDISSVPGPGGVGATVAHVSASFNGNQMTDDIAIAVALSGPSGGLTANVGNERVR